MRTSASWREAALTKVAAGRACRPEGLVTTASNDSD